MSTIQKSLTSVTTCTHNMQATLPKTVESVLNQDCPDFEYLILDDGSSDGSWDYLESFASHPKIRLYRNLQKQGLTSCRNFLLHESRGAYLSVVDADDWLAPNKVSLHAKELAANPRAALVWGSSILISPSGSHQIPKTYPLNSWDLCSAYEATHSAITWRRDVLIELGGYDEKYELVEAVNLFLRTGDHYEQLFCEPVAAFKGVNPRNSFRSQLSIKGKALSATLLLEALQRRYDLTTGAFYERLSKRANPN